MPFYKYFHEKAGGAFYGERNIGQYTFAKYKVAWKRMANDLQSVVISQFKTSFGEYKLLLPFETTAFISTQTEAEAHYFCAIINSNPVRDFIKSFSSAGRGFAAPSVMEHIAIPKFDPKNKVHQQLSDLSQKCHELKKGEKLEDIVELEKRNDGIVRKLFCID